MRELGQYFLDEPIRSLWSAGGGDRPSDKRVVGPPPRTRVYAAVVGELSVDEVPATIVALSEPGADKRVWWWWWWW